MGASAQRRSAAGSCKTGKSKKCPLTTGPMHLVNRSVHIVLACKPPEENKWCTETRCPLTTGSMHFVNRSMHSSSKRAREIEEKKSWPAHPAQQVSYDKKL